MNIHFIINSLAGGGAERVMATLANGFSLQSKVSLITFNNGNSYPIDPKVNRVYLHGGTLKNHTLRSWKNLYSYYRVKENRPDAIVVFMPANALIVVPIAKIFGIKVIISEHNNHKANPSTKSKWTRKLLYPLANAVTILTSYDLEFFKKMNQKVVIMPNPIVLPDHVPEFRNRKKNILAAGSFKRLDVKGFERLIKISAPILKQHPDWTLTIAGSGGNGIEILRGLSQELGIEGMIILPGFCKNIQEMMQQSQVYALPSKYEGLPMVLMEALSNGMACIAYDCISGPGDLIENKSNGILIEDQNEELFGEGLKMLISDDEFRNEIASNGPESMVPYNISNILERWNKLFNEIKSN
ncbi:glycosyltransferase family 4 protein [Allomuricauda sp. NBRC 101325]|uniref:glycosyltransferase family 4 protein n=1 Tax=Allomuricauda sp. NBRC 101325 TaxID=1113758 RepID=UPI00249FBEEC|nr:glycosyltransferase family 4 protein [Muricauda sp. NBRC 101325]GLU44895.1 glycosyl transferase [Muricauda sp. NBRC 101325]